MTTHDDGTRRIRARSARQFLLARRVLPQRQGGQGQHRRQRQHTVKKATRDRRFRAKVTASGITR